VGHEAPKTIKEQLDAELTGRSAYEGIAFSPELLKAFVERGVITMEKFGLFGSKLFARREPAYRKTHYAHRDRDLKGLQYRIGQGGLWPWIAQTPGPGEDS